MVIPVEIGDYLCKWCLSALFPVRRHSSSLHMVSVELDSSMFEQVSGTIILGSDTMLKMC